MDRLVVVKFHTNIANRWLFMTQRKIMVIMFCSSIILTCLGGVFSRTRCIVIWIIFSRLSLKIFLLAVAFYRCHRSGMLLWTPCVSCVYIAISKLRLFLLHIKCFLHIIFFASSYSAVTLVVYCIHRMYILYRNVIVMIVAYN